jgi:RNA polymerase sigma factor (sigma-70 family)
LLDADPFSGVPEGLRSRLRAMALRLGVPAEDVDDVVHDTLLAGLEKLAAHHGPERATVTTWVHGILKYKVRDYWREKRRAAGRFVELDDGGQAMPAAVFESLTVTPDRDAQLLVVSVLTKLPPRERAALLMNVQDGRPAREIAPLLGVRQKVAEKLLTRAKKRFAQLILAQEESRPQKRLIRGGQ